MQRWEFCERRSIRRWALLFSKWIDKEGDAGNSGCDITPHFTRRDGHFFVVIRT